MKVISETVLVKNTGNGLKAPTKPDVFKKIKNNEAGVKCMSIPKDDPCVTESRSSPCLASKYVTILKRMHKSLAYETLNCKHCSKLNTSVSFNEGRNLIFNFTLEKLCIFENEMNCPRVTQVRSWLVRCRYLRHIMRKCKKHKSFVKNLKDEVKLKWVIFVKILK